LWSKNPRSYRSQHPLRKLTPSKSKASPGAYNHVPSFWFILYLAYDSWMCIRL
jgi:hypothetical protein